jgi:glycosyltransferase involved in cell wall biosynthesis
VLYVGRFEPEKGIETLMEAWSALAAHAQLVLVGEGSSLPDLRVWSRRCEDSVRLFAPVPNPHDFFRAADIFVFPSRTEGFGNALAEAMESATAVVTTRVGMALEYVRDEENGLCFDIDDATGLAARVRRLLEDPPLRERLGGKARSTARQEFSIDRMATRYEELYRSLAAGNAARSRTTNA